MDVRDRLRSPFLLVIGLLFLAQPVRGWFASPAHALPTNQQVPRNLIVVTTTADDFAPTNGTCSLREAMYAASYDSPIDACAAGSVADTVVLPAGTYTLTRTGNAEDAGLTGDLDITGTLQLTGATSATTILDGGEQDRLFEIFSGSVSLSNLTLRDGLADLYGGAVRLHGGALTVSASTLTNNIALPDGSTDPAHGGAIANHAGALTITDSLLQNNFTQWWVKGPQGFGGAIFSGTGTRTAVVRSTIRRGYASHGGAVYNAGDLVVRDSLFADNEQPLSNSGAALIDGSRFLDNDSPNVNNEGTGTMHIHHSELAGARGGEEYGCDYGGAIFNSGGHLTLTQSYLHDNKAHWGGAIGASGGTVAIRNSALIGNLAVNEAVVYAYCNGFGGAVWASNTRLTIENSTLGDNWAEYKGGGLYAAQVRGHILNTTIVSNRIDLEPLPELGEEPSPGGAGLTVYGSTALSLTNTLVSGNTSLVAPTASDCYGTLTSGGYILIAAPTPHCAITGTLTGTLTGVDPRLEPLGEYGGSTLTYALATHSPAIDAGSPLRCPAIDQRGFARPADGDGSAGARCDIGAYERQPDTGEPTVTPVATVTPPPTVTPGPCPMVTPEPLWVQPVQSPTNALTQTIEIYAGRALTVTVASEAGTVTQAGGETWPAWITINLLPGTTHHLIVTSHVTRTVVSGCVYGGYTLDTALDRYGQPLTIVQHGAATVTPTVTPVPTATASPPAFTAVPTTSAPGSGPEAVYLPLVVK